MEPQKSLRSSKDGAGLDRLSDMPDQVIVHILSYLPTRDAVRTMLLRRFGNLWTLVWALRFDFSEHYVNPLFTNAVADDDFDDSYDKEQPLINEAISRFARFVQNVMMLHRRSTIDLFQLHFDQYKGNYEEFVDQKIVDDVKLWLQFAVDRQVNDLSFICDYLDNLVPPRCVFTSQNLVTLELVGPWFERYEHQPQLHMGSLRKLSLIGVNGDDDAYNQLISACPSLEDLYIHLADGLQTLNITAPSASKLYLNVLDRPDQLFTLNCPHVKILDIEGFRNSRSFMLDVKDVSSLQEVNIGSLPIGLPGVIEAFLKPFRDAEVFTMSNQCFKLLCGLEKIDIPQNSWQFLGFRPKWNHERCVEVIIKLVKSSANLEELVIYNRRSSGNREVHCSELSTSCEIPLLKEVTIFVHGKCCAVQLQLVEFILRNAVVLEKLVITSEKYELTEAEKLDLVQQVSKFKRASVNAVVDFD